MAMEWNIQALQLLCDCFKQAIHPNPEARRQAEAELIKASNVMYYGFSVLHLTAQTSIDDQIRQSAAVNFKNHVRLRWGAGAEASICDTEKEGIKNVIVDRMLRSGPLIRSQLSEALVVISNYDFPNSWKSLLPLLVVELKNAQVNDDYEIINATLCIAKSIFNKYRCQIKTPALLADLRYCVDIFAPSLFGIFIRTSDLIDSVCNTVTLPHLLESQLISCQVFFTLNFQDIPRYFRNHLSEWLSQFLRFLKLTYPTLESTDDRIRALNDLKEAICESINLYMQKYEDEFKEYLIYFAEAVWQLVCDGSLSSNQDRLAISALKFLITSSMSIHHKLFMGDNMPIIYDRIVAPNLKLRKEDEELFEDNYVDFYQQDMEGGDLDTRRKMACELLKGIAKNYKDQITTLIRARIDNMLTAFEANPAANWKEKDCAIYLVASIATKKADKSSVSTDIVDVENFFNRVIVPELQSQDVNGFPMLKAGSLKFFAMFRNKIPKDTTIKLMPDVIRFLTTESNVVHSYAANCIEKLVLVKDLPNLFEKLLLAKNVADQPRYTYSEISPLLEILITNLFNALKFQKSEDNPYVMRCIMNVIGVAEFSLEAAQDCMISLSSILGDTYKNPKNPIFNHYLFEAVAGLVRRACEKHISLISSFEAKLFPIIQDILAIDSIHGTDLWPYGFQILSQLIELSKPCIHLRYTQVFYLLLTFELWQKRATIPALVRVLEAYLKKAPPELDQHKTLRELLGIFKRLVLESSTEDLGFYVLNTVTQNISYGLFSPYVGEIWTTLFTKSLPTENFLKSLVILMAHFVIRYGPASLVESVEPHGIFKILSTFWIPCLKLFSGSDNMKLVSVAAIKLLCDCRLLDLEDPSGRAVWGEMLGSIVSLISVSVKTRVEEPQMLEIGERTFIFLHNVGKKDVDPVKEIKDPKEFLVSSLQRLARMTPKLPEFIEGILNLTDTTAFIKLFK